MLKGNVIGFRTFEVVTKSTGRKSIATQLCVRRLPDCVRDGMFGVEVDNITAFEQAMGDYRPQLGDGIGYHIMFVQGRQQVGFVMPLPELDE